MGFTKMRATSHFLYVPDRDATERAGQALARAGFTSEAGPAAGGGEALRLIAIAVGGAKVVVTGGAGNVGSPLVDAVIKEGAREVLALHAIAAR